MLNSGLQQEIDKTFQIQKKYSEELRSRPVISDSKSFSVSKKLLKNQLLKSTKQQMMIFVGQKLKLICLKLW